MLSQTHKETRYLHKVDPYQAFCIVNSVKQHFNGSYDAVKYNYKMKWFTPNKFAGRRDQYFYRKLADQYPLQDDVIRYAVSNILAGNDWIGDMTDDVYNEYQGKLQSISYIFKNDLKQYGSFEELFNIDQMPFIVEEMFGNRVTLETATILDCIVNYTSALDSHVTDNLIWPDQRELIKNYKAFVPLWINITKMKKIALSLFTK